MTNEEIKAVREAMEVCMCPTVAEGKAMLAEIERLRSLVRDLGGDPTPLKAAEGREDLGDK